MTVSGRSAGGCAGGIATTGSACPGGLHTVTAGTGVRQFQPRASKSCQAWLVSCALETAVVATIAAPLGVAVGEVGLIGVWLHAVQSAQAATTAANLAHGAPLNVTDNGVIPCMLPPLGK